MMKQPFTKFGVTTLFSLLCSAFLHAQVVTDERMFSFEEPQIPDCITATHSRLSVSDLHYKDGKHSLEWTFEPGGILELKKDLKFAVFGTQCSEFFFQFIERLIRGFA